MSQAVPPGPGGPSGPGGPDRPAGALVVLPVHGIGEVAAGDDLAAVLWAALTAGPGLLPGDVLAVSSKVVSKALGLVAPPDADRQALVLRESARVVAERATARGVTRVVEALAGPVMVGAGIDASNTGPTDESDETVLLLPLEPDACARTLRTGLLEAVTAERTPAPRRFGLVLSDTAGRPWRHGQTDFALGSAGLLALDDLRGSRDADGRDLHVTSVAVADEIASAADLVRPKAGGIAAALLRGLPTHLVPPDDAPPADASSGQVRSDAGDLVRTGPTDWFSLGRVEAVRSALGVPPGTAAALDLGIPSVAPEDVETRLDRACRLALTPDAVGDVPPGHPRARMAAHPVRLADVHHDVIQWGVSLSGPDELTLGVAAGRLLVALEAEDLHGRIVRHTPAARPGSAARVDIVLL